MSKITNEIVIDSSRKIGFDLVGFAKAESLDEEFLKLNIWLEKNYHAEMKYMEKNLEKRLDVKNIFPNAVSVISLGLNYYYNENFSEKKSSGKISRYAWGKDYHFVMWQKCEDLITQLKNIDNSFEAVYYVDTGPVMDKVWAVRSGLGWQGKHTNVINKEIGSWFFIATIICNKTFSFSNVIADFCGSCTACIDACPTDAIVQPYLIDSNKCISYQTIENKNEIDETLKGKFDNWIFGCDICQDVCPWNIKFFAESKVAEFEPVNVEIETEKIINMTEKEFSERFNLSPIKRTKLKGLKRNAKFVSQ
ncbi:MAG: tRNA epoxyqueuosine(34) reductase QueG [Chlorobiaceae bacterium]|nr:tRNA epoxyqueuosine(34) reductase QueG [Chlorobiaceae bacterium]MBA4309342.1 tRNA epoxyqueuosine(34) reductase QueG [Chlorobiaceae bacterium]